MVETNISDREGVREVFLSQGYGNDTVDILRANWRKSTSNLNLHLVTRFHQLDSQFRLH